MLSERLNSSALPDRKRQASGAQVTAYWPGWDIARKLVIFPDGGGGYVMDAWGGLHPFGINGAALVSGATASAYWPGWNIARDVVIASGHSGYILDGRGRARVPRHRSPGAPNGHSDRYWPGWNIARGNWFVPGSTTQGYTLDGWGGLRPIRRRGSDLELELLPGV